MTQQARLIHMVDGSMFAEVLPLNLEAFEIRGYAFSHIHNSRRTRAELQGAPVFSGLCGPMWDGDMVRYEDSTSNAILST